MENDKDDLRKDKKNIITELGTSDVAGLLIGIIGAVISIVDLAKNPAVSIVAILTSEILLIIGWGYFINRRYRVNQKLEDRDRNISDLKNEISDKEAELKSQDKKMAEERNKIMEQLSKISLAVKNNNIHSNNILVKIPSEGDEQYQGLEQLMEMKKEANPETTAEKIVLQDKIQERIKRYAQKYATDIFELFNLHCRDITIEAVNLQNAYLSLKNIPLTVAITVKLLNRPFHPKLDNADDFIVYTAFRDHDSYTEKKREVGTEPYSINGNSAFHACMHLQRESFLMNNIVMGQDGYNNENDVCYQYYNCVIVVPIRLKRADGKYKYFGFLCCDTLNEDTEHIKKVFDDSAAQYMYAFAQNMATFLETLDANWIDRYKEQKNIPNGILEMLYQKIYKGKRKYYRYKL